MPLLQKVDEDGGVGVVKGEVTRGLMGSAVEAIMRVQSAFWAKPGMRFYIFNSCLALKRSCSERGVRWTIGGGWLAGVEARVDVCATQKGDIKKNMGRLLNGRLVTGQSNKSLPLCVKIKSKGIKWYCNLIA